MRSMTGYGQAHAEDEDLTINAEFRSVNHRFYKLVCHLPDGLAEFEGQLEELVRKRVSRGTVELDVTVKEKRRRPNLAINNDLVKAYLKQLKGLATGLKLKSAGIDLALLLGLPGVMEVENDAAGHMRAHMPKLRAVVEQALDQISEMRAREGKRLAATLTEILKRISAALERVKVRAPLVPGEYQTRLATRLETLLAGKGPAIAPSDLARELAIFADRCDIAEEIQRLDSHLAEFRRSLKKEDGDIGKQLDFLTQEMVREANTMGSKANDAEISQCVIAIKAEVERLKEQVQNVE
ncbi:MAG: YicC family protein [Planctomycetes bacterium]|nr:YicC family protein [Planctomycetota bacterium]